MAGEVIRDVILRMRIEHAETKALDAARKQAGEAASATANIERSIKKQTGEIDRFGKNAKAAYDAITIGAKDSAIAVGKLTATERALNRVYEQRLDLLIRMKAAAPAGVPGGGVIPGRPLGGGGGVPAGPGLGQGLEQLSSAAGKVALPVAIISMVPAVAQAIGGGIRSAAFSLFGTSQEAREKGSPFINSMMPTDQVQGSAIGDTAGLILNSRFGALAGPVMQGFGQRWQEERNAAAIAQQPTSFDFLSQEVEARQKHLALLEQVNDRERSMLQKELGGYEERIRINQQIIASEEARIDAAREQFGLLDAQQKQDMLRIAEKVKNGGVGSLAKSELEMVRGNSAFTGILSEQAKAEADKSGFQAIVDALDLNKNIDKAMGQLELNVEQQQLIKLELSNMDEATQRVVEKLRTVQEEFAEEMIQRLQNEIRRAALRGKPPAGPDF